MSAKSKISWNALSTIVLAATLLAVTYTAIMTKRSVDQMRRSVDLYKYQMLVQDRPHVVFGPFFCKYDKETKFLYVIGQGKCFGETPAYDFKNKTNLLFHVETSKDQLTYFQAHNEKERARVEQHFYMKGIVDSVLNFISGTKAIDKETLASFIENMQKNPGRERNRALGAIDVTLKIGEFKIYDPALEWLGPPTVPQPGGADFQITFGKSEPIDPIPSALKNERILMLYLVQEYEGRSKGEKIEAHYFGYLDGREPQPIIPKEGASEKEKEALKGLYRFQNYGMWTTRLEAPK